MKNWCFQTESSLDSKEIKPVNPKGYQPWIFTGRTNVEAPILWPPDVKSQLIGKDTDAGKDLRAGEEVGNRGWDDWMASPTQWLFLKWWLISWYTDQLLSQSMVGHYRTQWVRASSGGWWWTGKPGMLQSMGSQRVRHNWATELNWTEMLGLW